MRKKSKNSRSKRARITEQKQEREDFQPFMRKIRTKQ